jgi:2'-5' RNA ligase
MSTIGVAIAIPEPWATSLQAYRIALGDDQADAIPTHITLVPPTDVGDQIPAVEEHLAKVAREHPPFDIHLRGTATFRPVSPVVFIGVSEGISGCELLAAQARCGPLEQDLSFPYHPHVTVAHDLDEPSLDRAYETLSDFDCEFEVREFQLFVHDPDGMWRQLRSYRLGV